MSVRRSRSRPASTFRATVVLLGLACLAAGPPGHEDQGSKPTDPPVLKPAGEATRPEPGKTAVVTSIPLTPLPLTAIPDDPPPHEGALFDIPYVIEPPDLLIVEVLEALPGRPISGERLVRPDGTIDLGFYGSVHVRGLTLMQAKVKLIEQLVTFIPDEVLGLEEVYGVEERALPDLPPPFGEELKATNPRQVPKSSNRRGRPHPGVARPVVRTSDRTTEPPGPTLPAEGPATHSRVAGPVSAGEPPAGSTVIQSGGGVKITIEIGPQQPPKGAEPPAEPPTPAAGMTFVTKRIPPEDSNRVFIDVTAYNSKFYYIRGDVATPGRIPFTGRETVLDAIDNAGGLIHIADPKNIRLVRPARGGKPLKTYPIDLDAINRGEVRLNYQVFPGDRIIVGRDALVTATFLQDRQAAPFQTLANTLLQLGFATRTIAVATPGLTPPEREALIREWFDLWWKSFRRDGGPVPDEATFRELLLKQLKATGGPADPGKK